ncbi:MAG: CHAT domain-containing protein [Candidatus Eisenbacteria bacterium]|nr:CHAT domain-containing protein [Candidatus Eisenbacteria bacterium]
MASRDFAKDRSRAPSAGYKVGGARVALLLIASLLASCVWTRADDPAAVPASAPDSGGATVAARADVDSFSVGHNLYYEQRLAEAIPILEREYARSVRDSGATSLRVARVLDTLVPALWKSGRSQETRTLELAREAVAINEQHFGPEHPEVASSLFHIGVIRAMAGAYAEAEPIFARVLAIREGHLPPDHEDLPSSINALANIRYMLADFTGALPLYRRSLAMNETTRGSLDGQSISIRGNVANTLLQLGEYEEGRTLLEEQITLLEDKGLETEDLGYAYSLLGKIFVVLGDYPEALRARSRSLEIREAVHPEDHPRIAEALLNLGNTLWSTGDLAEGRALVERARGIWRRVHGEEHPYMSSFDEALGRLAFAEGNLAAARTHHERALALRARDIGEESPEVAETLHSLARIAIEESRWDAAYRQLTRALTIAEAELGPAHPRVAEYAHDLAVVEFHRGNDRAAAEHALRAERVQTEHLRLTLRGLPERQALQYAQQGRPSLDLALTLSDSFSGGDLIARIWDARIRSRAVIFEEMAARTRRSTIAGDPELAGLLTEYRTACSRLANLTLRGPEEGDADIYRRVLDDARREYERLERQLARATRGDDAELGSAGWTEVAGALPEGSALVAFVHFERSARESQSGRGRQPWYRVFVQSAGASPPWTLAIADGTGLDGLIADWRRAAAGDDQRRADDAPAAQATCDRLGGMLREIIWDPILARLPHITRVFLVPDGQLHLINPDALPAPDGRYLVEGRSVIHLLPAERDLLGATPPAAPAGGALIVGAPDFDALPEVAARIPRAATPHRTLLAPPRELFRGARPPCRELRTRSFPLLPAARQEVERVAGYCRDRLASPRSSATANAPVLVLTGAAASEDAVKQSATQRRLLHVATHAFFLDPQCTAGTGVPANPLLLAGLALAGANLRGAGDADRDDGILTAQEIAALDLSGTDWVVLSACESGGGAIVAGEGILGLARAVRIAGARSLVASLWSIDDEAARIWMEAFYEAGLQRDRSACEAVRAASRRVLRERRQRGLSTHPFYWAPFVATGDWRP